MKLECSSATGVHTLPSQGPGLLLQNLEKKGLKRRAEAAVEAAPALLEHANSSYAIAAHHRSYGAHTFGHCAALLMIAQPVAQLTRVAGSLR